jgi:hypothetical protein
MKSCGSGCEESKMLMEKEPKPLPSPLAFLQAVYSNESLSLSARLKAAIEAAQYVHPKLAVTATINSGDFAVQLDRAIERSRIIETKPMIEGSANVSTSDTKSLNGKPTIIDRRYRKW